MKIVQEEGDAKLFCVNFFLLEPGRSGSTSLQRNVTNLSA